MDKQTFIIAAVVVLACIAFWSIVILGEMDKQIKNAYERGMNEAKIPCNCTIPSTTFFNQGYAKAITDTQNATLFVGYCAAQQEAMKNGILAANNSALVIPTTILKEACFR
jgi:hypothetical protein